jgi:D-alanyl-D-alanine carboxypeptidase
MHGAQLAARPFGGSGGGSALSVAPTPMLTLTARRHADRRERLQPQPLTPSPRTCTMSLSRRFSIVAALALLVCAACGAGGPTAPGPGATQPSDSAFAAALRARLEAETKAGEFSGAVLVTRDGYTLFEGAYGLADREKGVANTPLTQFRVGSMDKMLTAVAVLQLVQAGKVLLDAPLGTYLPDYPNAALASKVTIHHLLTHTGGTGDIFGPEFTAHRTELRTTEDYLRLYGTRGLQFEPGAKWEYSNYGYLLLGAVIERVSGTSYYDYVAAHIHAPAGMTATGSAPEDSLVPGRAVGYTQQLVPGALVSNASWLPYRGTAAGGGYSTVGDFARFAGALREHRLLNPAHTELLLGGKVTIGQGSRYAYGFLDRNQVGRRLVGHGGGAPGMNGELTFEPNGGYVIVVLSNLDPQAATRVEAFILDRLPTSTASKAAGASAARSAPMPALISREAIALR